MQLQTQELNSKKRTQQTFVLLVEKAVGKKKTELYAITTLPLSSANPGTSLRQDISK